MVKEVLLPDLGEGIEGADVSEVVVSVGDTVAKDDTLFGIGVGQSIHGNTSR